MSEAIRKILEWLKEGKIALEEAESFLESLEKESVEEPERGHHRRCYCHCCCCVTTG